MTQTEHAAATGLILAVDTAADSVSAALIDAAGGVLEHVEREKNKHTERLLPLVDAVLKEGNVTVADCAAVAFGAGPGPLRGSGQPAQPPRAWRGPLTDLSSVCRRLLPLLFFFP